LLITVAELRYGARLAGWGTARLVRLDHELSRADTVPRWLICKRNAGGFRDMLPGTGQVITESAQVVASCKRAANAPGSGR
jgi:hypothetical protein